MLQKKGETVLNRIFDWCGYAFRFSDGNRICFMQSFLDFAPEARGLDRLKFIVVQGVRYRVFEKAKIRDHLFVPLLPEWAKKSSTKSILR